MKVGSWKRTLLAGALSTVALWPIATYAAPADAVDPPGAGPSVAQFFGGGFGGGGFGGCQALGGGSVVGPGVAFGSITQTASLGSGGYYGGYANPAYGTQGIGSFGGGFLNFTGGQPSPFASLAGSPYCAGQAFGGTTIGANPCVISPTGPFFNGGAGFNAGGFGGFGGFGFGQQYPFGGVGFQPWGASPFGLGLGSPNALLCR
jgi:hypothetical protein